MNEAEAKRLARLRAWWDIDINGGDIGFLLALIERLEDGRASAFELGVRTALAEFEETGRVTPLPRAAVGIE